MPQKPAELRQFLFRAWIIYLLGCAACALAVMYIPGFFPSGAPPMAYVTLCLTMGCLPGGWYMAGCWFIRQVQEKLIREFMVCQLVLGAFVLFAPLCFLPMMLTGLLRLHRLGKAAQRDTGC